MTEKSKSTDGFLYILDFGQLLLISICNITYNVVRLHYQHVITIAKCCVHFTNVRSELSILPQNTVVESNNPTILHCSTRLSYVNINWKYNGYNTIVRSCAVAPNLVAQFNTVFDQATGQCDLLVYRANQANAGSYSCDDNGFNSPSIATAYLIVLGKYT